MIKAAPAMITMTTNAATVITYNKSAVRFHHHHHIRLLHNRQNAVAQTEMRGEEITYKS